jgi:photosystem II stability/assembly factor-like uncharacterized protein
MHRPLVPGSILALACTLLPAAAKDKPDAGDLLKPETFQGLALRGIGPAMISGRIGDLAVDPGDPFTWYVAAASGGVWKTVNAGTSWTPIFDDQASFSIGCLALDPKDPLTLWVGTGENNSQRSVSFGDGVYRSSDGGKTWENLGLKDSQHIGKIVIDPRDSNVVYVAAQGPLWSPGGDRGLYRTGDAGHTWSRILEISENTGVNELVLDPRRPDVMLASAYQRRRHVWTLIDGGPESGIHRSTDGGKTWAKITAGLPKEEMGRIGLAASPAQAGLVYAAVEAAGKESGFYRSTDFGLNWERMSDTTATAPMYYNEIIADLEQPGRVYLMDTFMQVTEDGGRTFRNVGERTKHVDNHALWIDPRDTDHLLAGCDGGVYESFDRGATWVWMANLPLAQFYKVAVDQERPFYHVYGGTQDNETVGGPTRTASASGIVNSDWFVTVSGDGFQSQVDPEDPNIIYSQAQHGALVRFDRRTGEALDIQPQPGKGEPALRWNWDSPLLLSPHSRTRLYFAANRLFRSDDRGDTWRAVSEDLTRQIDRNKLPVMGRVFGVDAVAKSASTSFYGNIVALAESPRIEGLLYVGTDDGLIQISEDGGATWTKRESFPGVPENSYVSRLHASPSDADTVYATFDNHKMGDFKPYVLRSTDRGRRWSSIAGDLPERGPVYAILEDPANRELLFAGTEFGVFFSPDGGGRWVQLKGGMPTIAVRDLAIQAREDDLVVATFGRGFYILDDYAPLRSSSAETLQRAAELFKVRPAAMFVPSLPFGLPGKGFNGDAFFTAPNPPFGAVFTYYLKDELRTKREARQKAEKEKVEKGEDVPYPSWDDLRAEEREEKPTMELTVTDEEGTVVRRLAGPVGAGFHRLAWDLRYPAANPTDLRPPDDSNPFVTPRQGPLAPPGEYRVALAQRVGGVLTPLGEAQPFTAQSLYAASLGAADREALAAFQRKTARLQRAVLGAVEAAREGRRQVEHLTQAIHDAPGAEARLGETVRALDGRLRDLQVALNGDAVVAERNEPTPPAIVDRVQGIVAGSWATTSAPTETHKRAYEIAADEFGAALATLRGILETDLPRLQQDAELAGAPWTPGRVPQWVKE